MATYYSGSDGNIYRDPYKGTITGSLYKTSFITITRDSDDPDSEQSVPGILYDTTDGPYFSNVRWSLSSLMDSTSTFSTSSMQGCVWVYNLNDSQKTTIENDANYIATYVTSSL